MTNDGTLPISSSSDKPPRINVAVVGNSNSVAVTSYANLLALMPDVNVINHSLGGVPNIALLTFLTDEDVDFERLDFIIIDVAVIESQLLHPGSSYSLDRSKSFIDLFASEVSKRSKAKLLFLILPTLSALLYPNKSLAEKHYIDCAKMCGAAILNVYAIIRQLGSLDAEGPPRRLAVLIERFLNRFELPESFRDPCLWRIWLRQHPAVMQKAEIGTIAFAESCFEDGLHVSRALHDIIARIIYGWLKHHEAERTSDGDAQVKASLVLRALPRASRDSPEFIKRETKLISRNLARITAGETLTYQCPPDFVAVGILINESRTSGYLNFHSAACDVSIDARCLTFPMPWKALVILILEDVGGGEVSVEVSDSPKAALTALKPYYSVTNRTAGSECSAELGELLLVHRQTLDGHGSGNVRSEIFDVENLEESPSAKNILEESGNFGAKAVDGVRRSSATISRLALKLALDKIQPGATEANLIKDKARLLALAGEFGLALTSIAEGRRQYPDDAQLADMENAVSPLLP